MRQRKQDCDSDLKYNIKCIFALGIGIIIGVIPASIASPISKGAEALVPHSSAVKCPHSPKIIVHEILAEESYFSRFGYPVLHSVVKIQGENETLQQSHNNCTKVTVSCRSSQPIAWIHDGTKGGNIDEIIKSFKVSRTAADPWSEKTFCYEANVTLEVPSNVYTGWYTCSLMEEVDNGAFITLNRNASEIHTQKSSIFLFRNDNQNQNTQLLLENPLVSVFPSELNEVVLPLSWRNDTGLTCEELRKLDLGSLTFQPVNKAVISINYEGRIHFTNADDIPGTYKCADNNGSEAIFAIKNKAQDNPLRTTDLVIDSYQLESCGKDMYRFTCKSTFGEREIGIRMKVLDCENPIHCNLLWTPSPEYLQTMPFENTGSRQFCSSKQSGSVICSTHDGLKYEYASYIIVKENKNTKVVLNPAQSPLDLTSQLTIMDDTDDRNEEYVCVTNTMTISCTASKYLFSDGLQLAVRYKNGSVESTNGMVVSGSSTPVNGYHHYTWSVNVTCADITSYICMAPLINSREWMNVSSPDIEVIYGSPPQILVNDTLFKMSEPHVQFYEYAENVSIRCVAMGVPQPEISWLKDGHDFSLTYKSIEKRNDKNHERGNMSVTVSELIIPKMKDLGADIRGTWVCNASNGLKPDGLYKIDIQIRKDRPTFIWIPIVILVCLTIALTAYLRQMYWLRKVRKTFNISQDEFNKFMHGDKDLVGKLRKIGQNMRSNMIERGIQFSKENNACNTSKASKDLQNLINKRLEEFDGRLLSLAMSFPKNKLLSPEHVTEDLDPESFLGDGNFGAVIKGEYLQPNGVKLPVAIKTAKVMEDVRKSCLRKLALLEELKILAYVGDHPCVVRLIGAVIVQDASSEKIQAVLELCETSLKEYVAKYAYSFIDENGTENQLTQKSDRSTVCGPYVTTVVDFLKTQDLVRWSFQIACGMQYLASKKIIHRDLAARNVLLSRNNGEYIRNAKITDFGLSKQLRNNQKEYVKLVEIDSAPELPWRNLAPEFFICPERLQFSEATDVWAFGITLWEIFTLAQDPYPQYEGPSSSFKTEMKNQLRNPKPKYATDFIYDVMLKCWHKDPVQRPKFTELTTIFRELLPKDYVCGIPKEMYEPPNCDYYNDLETLLCEHSSTEDAVENPLSPRWYKRIVSSFCQ